MARAFDTEFCVTETRCKSLGATFYCYAASQRGALNPQFSAVNGYGARPLQRRRAIARVAAPFKPLESSATQTSEITPELIAQSRLVPAATVLSAATRPTDFADLPAFAFSLGR